jgi:glycosyltransferase involved in cell wall biosynthesis
LQKTNNLTKVPTIYYTEAKNDSLVSVIITTKNEEKNIGNCLRSIKNQTFKDIELIVVDNFSKDKTAEIAKKYAATVYYKGNERSTQRNYGAKIANGEYILYLDADMILNPTLIADCVAECKRDLSDALYVPERIVGEGFWIKVRDFERSFYTGTVIDAVRFIRRDLFLQIGGFDETLIGPEDWDLDRKIRKVGRTGINLTPLFHNEGRLDMNHYLKKKSYYTDGIQKYIEKWGPSDSEIKKQTGIRYRLIDVFIEQGKWKRVVCHPPFAITMYWLRFRVALAYLLNRA